MSVPKSHAMAYAAMALYVVCSSLLSPMYKPCLAAGMQPITTMMVRFLIVGAGRCSFPFHPATPGEPAGFYPSAAL
ncbi:MAG: hypothetical protein ACLUVV_05145 [Christensenellales bacterium]